MKKLFLLALALCGSLMSANAGLTLASIEEPAWINLSTTDFASNDYVGEWGRLRLVDKQLCSETGDPIQLRGWSTYSINYPEVQSCLSETYFDLMKTWGANIVRLAIYPRNSTGSYSSAANTTIEKYIQYAYDRHMYVLIDWHVSSDDTNSGDPATYKSSAKQLFTGIAKWASVNGYNNILYEICNECSKTTSGTDVTWTDIKNYANEILPIIEKNDPGAIVIVGTPQKSLTNGVLGTQKIQGIGDVINSPIPQNKYPNLGLMYAFHYYACSNSYNNNDINLAILKRAAADLPCFVSQWSSGSDTLGCNICKDSADVLLTTLQPGGNNGNQLISWCYWAWGKKKEATNTFTESSVVTLTEAGAYIRSRLTGKVPIPEPGVLTYYTTQDIPTSEENYGVLNIGYFDYGGEGVAYHDFIESIYEDPRNEKYYQCDNMGAVYKGESDLTKCFRYDEVVDVNNICAGLGANWGEPGDGFGNTYPNLYNLVNTWPDEWLLYHINVKKAGYYTVKCLTDNSTSSKGSIGMAIAKGTLPVQNGNILRRWSDHNDKEALQENPLASFALHGTPSCGLMYDGTINEEGASNGDKSQDWTCWGWTDCGATDADKEDLTVLFKYVGEQELQITISPDSEYSPGDISNFVFTFKSAEIPGFEYEIEESDGVENELAEDANFAIAPNPTDGQFVVSLNGKANVEITNMMGIIVFSDVVDGTATINKNLASGIYIVRVGDKTRKLIVK